MGKKSTEELENILGNTHVSKIGEFITENKKDFLDSDRPFANYMHEIIRIKKLKQQNIFLDADIPERYGYKLLSEQKKTKQRDIILRLCYAMEMTLEETQKALKIYEMPELYAKIPRDAALMIIFNTRPGSIIEVNTFLKNNGMESLRSSGVQE